MSQRNRRRKEDYHSTRHLSVAKEQIGLLMARWESAMLLARSHTSCWVLPEKTPRREAAIILFIGWHLQAALIARMSSLAVVRCVGVNRLYA